MLEQHRRRYPEHTGLFPQCGGNVGPADLSELRANESAIPPSFPTLHESIRCVGRAL